MFKQVLAGVIGVFLLSSPALAMPPQQKDAHRSNSTRHLASPPGRHGVLRESNSRIQRLAMHESTRGDREVRALNTLEAAGYRQFKDVHADGANFTAVAHRAGKTYEVTVTPSGAIMHKGT